MASFVRKNVGELPYKVLLHMDAEAVSECINGELITMEPGQPIEIDRFIANKIIEMKGPVHGIVEVEMTRSEHGLEYDIEGAKTRALSALGQAEKSLVEMYVKSQMEDRIAQGRPAIPPNGRVADILRRRNVSLYQVYGLRPVGWEDSGAVNAEPRPTLTAAATLANSERLLSLETENAELKKDNQSLHSKLDRLISMLEPVETGAGAKAQTQAQAEQPKKKM